jgi:hypothetical protein
MTGHTGPCALMPLWCPSGPTREDRRRRGGVESMPWWCQRWPAEQDRRRRSGAESMPWWCQRWPAEQDRRRRSGAESMPWWCQRWPAEQDRRRRSGAESMPLWKPPTMTLRARGGAHTTRTDGAEWRRVDALVAPSRPAEQDRRRRGRRVDADRLRRWLSSREVPEWVPSGPVAPRWCDTDAECAPCRSVARSAPEGLSVGWSHDHPHPSALCWQR